MKNHKEIYEALMAGETLYEVYPESLVDEPTGYTAWLDAGGNTLHAYEGRQLVGVVGKRDFASPGNWRIQEREYWVNVYKGSGGGYNLAYAYQSPELAAANVVASSERVGCLRLTKSQLENLKGKEEDQ